MRSLLAVLGSLLFLSTFAPGAVAYSQSSKLEGQIVCCANCWAREDRTKVSYGTTDDLQKAADCIGNGDPTLLAVIDTGIELPSISWKTAGSTGRARTGWTLSASGLRSPDLSGQGRT